MSLNPIAEKYEEMKRLFSISPLNPEITDKFKEINDLCLVETKKMKAIPITSSSTAKGKNYFVFSVDKNGSPAYSRPVNLDLYEEGLEQVYEDDGNEYPKIEQFWLDVKNRTIANQSAEDITSALYTISMNYCCCADLVEGVKNNSGDFFEKLIGHLFAMHLNLMPSTKMNAVELDGQSIPLPTDYIFDLGSGKPKYHVPVKTSTRERVVEVWAQQRILDGAFGVGRFLCLLVCIGETNFVRKNMSVDIVCVPNQWMNYQLFVSQLKRAYYLDVPDKYNELNERFPRIHVKQFGEFFHESSALAD